MIVLNVAFPTFLRSNDRLYVVEINRFMVTGQLENTNVISDVTFFNVDEDTEVLDDLFARNPNRYVIRPAFNIEGELDGFFQFQLTQPPTIALFPIQLAINVLFVLLAGVTLSSLLYIKYKIILPFHEISQLPMELSKGEVKKGIPESKSRFFGEFIWGLNMMRETLAAHKIRELELLKEKKTLILSLSHDISTPLSAIKLGTRALSSNLYPDPEKQQEVLEQMMQKTVEIDRFVAEIINVSKEDLLTFDVKNKEFYLKEVIDQIEVDYKERLALNKTEWLIDRFTNRLLLGDPIRLVEVLQNLMENAIKYGDGKQILLSFDTEEEFQLITVTNGGNSLSEAELVHLFDSFWRGSNAKNKSGSGLGLYICKQLTRQMKGDVFAKMTGDEIRVSVVVPKA